MLANTNGIQSYIQSVERLRPSGRYVLRKGVRMAAYYTLQLANALTAGHELKQRHCLEGKQPAPFERCQQQCS
jgi:hypothetical protein